jgi:hypothetical protein
MRPKLINFKAYGLKNNTRFYPFFDKKPVSQFCCMAPDIIPDSQLPDIQHVPTGGGELKSNSIGVVEGYFEIPKETFNTGERRFRLTESEDNAPPSVTQTSISLAENGYRAHGILETKQATVLALKNAEILATPVNDVDNIVITDKDVYVIETRKWVDPVAQTFLVESKGGAFITSVNIYFATKPPDGSEKSIRLQIREVTGDGRPSPNRIIPGAIVEKFTNEVSVSLPGNELVPTNFKFQYPIHLAENTDYALCLISDSNEYTVYVATKTEASAEDRATYGEDYTRTSIISPTEFVGEDYRSKDQYVGVFFKSQNASTWSDDQLTDLKFDIFKAKFNTTKQLPNQSAYFECYETSNTVDYITRTPSRPLKVRSGSNLLKVYCPNHDLKPNDLVTITFSDDCSLVYYDNTLGSEQYVQITEIVNGQSVRGILLNRPVRDVDIDYFFIESPANNLTFSLDEKKEYSGFISGSDIRIIANKKMDEMILMLDEINFTGSTSTSHQMQLTKASNYLETTQYQDVSPFNVNQFEESMIITSPLNRPNVPVHDQSFSLYIYMQSTNENLSPVVDTQRMSLALKSARTNNPTKNVNNFGQGSGVTGFDDVDVIVSADAFTATYNSVKVSLTLTRTSLDDEKVQQLYNILSSGKYILIYKSDGTPVISVGTMILKRVMSLSGGTTSSLTLYLQEALQSITSLPNVKIVLRDNYVDEIASLGGSCAAKYVTKRISLANAATSLRVLFAGYRNPECAFDVYAKFQTVGDALDIDEKEYLPVLVSGKLPSGTIEPHIAAYSYKLDNLEPFTSVVVKIVMRGPSIDSETVIGTALPHSIPDFRLIALE